MSDEDERPEAGTDTEPLAREPLRDEDRVLLMLAYLGPLALVTIAAGRSEYVRWHGRQGLLLAVTGLVTFVVLRPVHALAFRIWGFLGELFVSVEILVGVGFFLVAIFCMVRALEGTRFRVPLLGEIVDRF